jgi:hypothetical protein
MRIFIIISLLMSPLLGHEPSLWITHKEVAKVSKQSTRAIEASRNRRVSSNFSMQIHKLALST